MTKKSAPDDELELPVAFLPCSNGETIPRAPSARDRAAVELFVRAADANARRLGVSRRDFVRSACGMATALATINVAYGCNDRGSAAVPAGAGPGAGGSPAALPSGATGPGYELPKDAGLDASAACERIAGDEFVFDVQTHHVNPLGAWRQLDPLTAALIESFPYVTCGEPDPMTCFGREHYVNEVFVNSDTTVACLSGVPAAPTADPLTFDERLQTQAIVAALAGSPRLLVHASVRPDLGPAQIDAMQSAVERGKVDAWKVYPSLGAWRFDDETVAIPFVEKARSLGVKIICAHRGISTDAGGYGDLSSPREMVKVAQAYPDTAFLVYHSGWEQNHVEDVYDGVNTFGVDRLVRALDEFPTANVYAELGATFRNLMTKPSELAHALGKLLAAVGEDRVLWGTDCTWYGSPQEQIAAFRAFTYGDDFADAHGYPRLTAAIKRKVLGLNAAKVYGVDPNAVYCAIKGDDVSKVKDTRLDRPPWPVRGGYGPRSRREFFELLRRG